VSNPEFPGSYRPDPRLAGGFADAPEDRRERSGGRSSPGRGAAARSEDPGYPGRGRNGSGGYQAADGGGWGRPATGGRTTADEGGSRSGRPWSRADQGQEPRGRGAHEETSSGGRQGTSRPRGRQPGQGTVGTRGTSASRERYAAARERYAARVGATSAGRAGRTGSAGAGQDAGAAYGGVGGNGNGYTGNGHGGNGRNGAGYAGRRPGGSTALKEPDVRRRPGRHGGDDGGSGGGGREHRKGDWWRHWTLKKAVSIAAIAAGVMVILGAAGVGIAYAKTPVPTDRSLSATQAASIVYFSNNKTRVGQFGTVDRQLLLYNQIPANLRNAVVAAEDKNFWHEGGISPTGILRAAYYDLTSSGGNLQGGSTITQQLVRNYYANIGTAQTVSRKIKEIFIAQKLAQRTSKEQILKEYLNTVYFGGGAYGVGAAAQYYFGLSPSQINQITPAQAAMIAAMIQSPSGYSPNPKAGASYQALVARWHYVINAMVGMGTLSPQEAAKAKFPTVVKPFNNSWGGYRGYIMQAVLNELQQTYGYSLDQLHTKGLHIVTTFSKSLMDSLYATVKQDRALMKAGAPPTPPFGAHVGCGPRGCLPGYVNVGAVLENPANGAILAMYSGENYNSKKRPHAQLDNALQSRNQVGSSFKPYVLATAVKQGMNVQTSQLTGFSPLWIPPDADPTALASLQQPSPLVHDAGSYFEVVNDEVSNPNRPVSVVDATAMSLNTAYTDLWHRVAGYNLSGAPNNVTNMAKAFGVDVSAAAPKGNGSGLQDMQDQSGVTLGQASLTVEEQATMIATLADGGVYHTPHVIKDIIVGNATTQAKVDQREVLTPDEAAEVDYALSFDMGSLGTANGLGLTNGQTVIAKTGTTNLSQQAFFLGATPRYAMAVGMFVNNNQCEQRLPLSEQAVCSSSQALAFQPPSQVQTLFGVGGLAGYGGQWPAIIWHDYFMKQFNTLPVQSWPALPANFGSAWNLVPPLPKPKPKPQQCDNGNGNPFRCRNGNQPPVICLPGSPIPCPGQTLVPGGGGGGGGAGGAGTVGGAAAGGIVTTGLTVTMLPAGARRWRARRRQRGPGAAKRKT
jgi:membrane peptidoglycan carboxypeptidase